MISARVAPLGRPIISRIFAPLLSGRGVVASFARAGLAPFLLALASFFGAVALAAFLVFAPLAVFWPLGAPFFWLASFFEESFSGATCAPCSATAAVSVVLVASAFFIEVFILSAVDSQFRDHMLNIPDRVAAMVAAESDAARCYEIIAIEIRKALNEFADSNG